MPEFQGLLYSRHWHIFQENAFQWTYMLLLFSTLYTFAFLYLFYSHFSALLTSLYSCTFVFILYNLICIAHSCNPAINTVDAALLRGLTVAVDAAPPLQLARLALSALPSWKQYLRWPLTFPWKWSFLVSRLYTLSLTHLCSCTQMTISWKHCKAKFLQLWGKHP